jgi:hypothetical protein
LHGYSRLTTPAFLCASLAGLSGCATTAELEALRTEVDDAHVAVATVAAENQKMRNEISVLRSEIDSRRALSSRRDDDSGASGSYSGYKWRKLHALDFGPD